jgi:hypothetical protein
LGANAYYKYGVADVVPKPRLSIRRSTASEVQLSWTTNAFDYRLEAANSLPATGWTEVNNAPMIVEGCFVVTIAFSGSERYFRLRKP